MIIFIIIWSLWFISEVILNRLFRSGSNDKKNQDRGSLRIIWVTIGIVNSLGIMSAILLKFPISSNLLIPYLGLFIITSGMILRFISVVSLGRFFTVDVTIRNNHKIKKDGVYRLVRHPSYTGSLISFIGLGISLNNWISLIIISLPIVFVMIHRIKIEERILTGQFGAEYIDYMKKSYRLIPWVY